MRFFTTGLFLFFALSLFSQASPWIRQDFFNREQCRIKTRKSDLYTLNIALLKAQLSQARNEYIRQDQKTYIRIPLSTGGTETFEALQTNTLAPALQAKYPDINNYIIRSIHNPRIHGRIDVTYQGFHAIISTGSGITYIDPAFEDNSELYLVYDRSDAIGTKTFECRFNEDHIEDKVFHEERVSDNNLRTYRLAISCTGEYSQFHGGTVPLTLSAMNTSINRVNFVYEHDFAVRFEIVENNDLLIWTNPTIDPYDNDDIGMQLDANQVQCDNIIGSANYDIGHIFSTGGGGLAGYAVACKNGRKAIGGTGSGSPINDPFDIDYVAHEIGHQMSGSHTQNNDCNRDNSASYEPGSASTIMGYAGICSPNVQNNSDAYFHGYSIREMGQYIVNETGNQCPVKTVLPGDKPVITASSGNYTIPRQTPFELTATATGDAPLLYLWEQYDKEIAEVQPPAATNTKGPLYRSYFADSTGIRTFPRINYIVNNTTNTWEVLSSVSRNINFILTVREDLPGGARHVQKNNRLTVDNSKGPFLVSYPNIDNITWFSGEKRTVTWQVANTDKSPVNCSEVNILLSEDGGYTYPHLIMTTANDGSEEITVPDITGKQMRIKIAAANNVFFDISNRNFEIKEGLPPFEVSFEVPEASLCKDDSISFYVRSSSVDAAADTILLSDVNFNTGIDIVFERDTLFDDDSVKVTIYNTGASNGLKNLELHFSSPDLVIVRSISVQALTLPNTPTLFSPNNYSENIAPDQTFRWNEVTGQQVSYELEIATDKNFDNIVAVMSGLSTLSARPDQRLENNTIYYWRVRALGQCGYSAYSTANIVRTGKCVQYYSKPFTTVPLVHTVVADTIQVDDLIFDQVKSIEVIGVRGYVEGVENISAKLVNGDQVEAKLWSEACSGNRDMDLTFSDNAATDQIPCDVNPQILGLGDLGIRPEEPLSAFIGTGANNTYSMIITDKDTTNSGSLEQWGLSICGSEPVCAPLRIPTTTRIYTADVACTDGDGWTHYSISADKNPTGNFELMVLSLRLNAGDEVKPEEVKIRIPSSARYTRISNAQYINDPTDWTVLNRHWLIDPEVQPASPVGVRFYLTEVEINSLLDIVKLSGQTDSLKVFSLYSNGILDPNPGNRHVGVTETDVRQHEAKLYEYNFSKYLEFTVPYLADGCVGAGGQLKVTSGTKDQTTLPAINIYPNPAKDQLIIDGFSNNLQYTILNLAGSPVLTGRMTQKGYINISELPSGTYFIRYQHDKATGTEKVQVIR